MPGSLSEACRKIQVHFLHLMAKAIQRTLELITPAVGVQHFS